MHPLALLPNQIKFCRNAKVNHYFLLHRILPTILLLYQPPVSPCPRYLHFSISNIGFTAVRKYLVVSQQRRALTLLIDNLATREGIAAQKPRHTNRKRKQEEQTANGKGKDPLKLEDVRLGRELADSGCCDER